MGTTRTSKKASPRRRTAAKSAPKPHRPAAAATSPEPARDPSDHTLEMSIGNVAREYRQRLDMTVAGLARIAGLSPSMLSKIENGISSPSLATLQDLSRALNVPVTALFRRFEETKDASYVQAGRGLKIERRGTRAGHQYHLLGHTAAHHSTLSVEPYLVTLDNQAEVFPIFQHAGLEFLYMLSGQVKYRYADKSYVLSPGDSLFFDASAPHGPAELMKLPIVMLCVISSPKAPEH